MSGFWGYQDMKRPLEEHMEKKTDLPTARDLEGRGSQAFHGWGALGSISSTTGCPYSPSPRSSPPLHVAPN